MQKRILIVDDEPAIRDMVAFALRKGEYEPVHAGDSREAQAAIAERVPDMILLDWMLPGTSGLELARRWRRDTLTRAVQKHTPGLRLIGLEAGCHALLALPDGAAEDEVVDAALRKGVRVYGLSRYRVDAERSGKADVPPSLVLGFGNVNEDRIRRGVEVLGRILRP